MDEELQVLVDEMRKLVDGLEEDIRGKPDVDAIEQALEFMEEDIEDFRKLLGITEEEDEQ